LEILSPNTSGVIWGLEIIQISNWVVQRFGNPESKYVGGNLGFDICQIAIGYSDPVWKFVQMVGEKLGFDTCQITIG
jgi:hypothetical protein